MRRVVYSGWFCQIAICAATCFAEPRYFFDDFSDGNQRDGVPVEWRATEGIANVTVNEEGLLVTDCMSEICALAPFIGNSAFRYSDVSMRLQSRLVNGELSVVPWARWNNGMAYYGFVRRDSGLVGVGTGNEIKDSVELFSHPVDRDVIIKVDIIGNQTSVAAWLAGDAASHLPVASFRDDSQTSGFGGISVTNRGEDPASVIYRWIEFAEILLGDVDTNSVIDVADIDHLSVALRDGLDDNRYDVNRDGSVNAEDHSFWISDVQSTWIGDANLDGEFNSSDIVQALQFGEYENGLAAVSTWATGDWNGDGEFDSTDLTVALADGGYEQGPRGGVASVPEPASIVGIRIAFLLIAFCAPMQRRDRGSKE